MDGSLFRPILAPMRLSNMNTPRHRRQGRGLHRAAAIGSLLVLGQSAYAETKAVAAAEGE